MARIKDDSEPGPVEVRLAEATAPIRICCKVISEDGGVTEFEIDSPTMRGAQREMTSYLRGTGLVPLGRWEGTAAESVRRFRPA